MAARLLGGLLGREDPAAATAHLEAAARLLGEIGARDELAKVWVAQAGLRRESGDVPGARALLERALVTFEDLGTLDEPAGVRTTLAAL